jgi:hypothetical protein
VSRVVFLACLAALLCFRCGGYALAVSCDGDAEDRAAIRGALRRVHQDEHLRMRQYFPEGGLFSLSFTGFALAAHARTVNDPALLEEARRELLFLLEKTEAERDVKPFAYWGDSPRRGVIFEGHQNLLRAAYVAVGGDDPETLQDFHDESARLAAAFARAPNDNLESFPHLVWPVDNVVALESLRLHDAFFRTDHARVVPRWTARLKKLRNKTGMPVSEIDRAGDMVRDGPRGCALSWLLAFLPALDPDLAQDLWPRYAREWGVPVVGMLGLREWPPGSHRGMDEDSGPVVHGIGAAASAFGVAAARANQDAEALGRMRLPLELLTFPTFNARGEKELLGGMVVLADALAVWGRTWTRLDAPSPPPRTRAPALPLALGLALALSPAIVAVALAARSWRRRERAWSARDKRVAAFHGAVLVVVVAAHLSALIAIALWLIGDRWAARGRAAS